MAPPFHKLYTSNGSELILGSKVGSGGEGFVATIHGQSHLVAKIYHRPLDSQKQTKLELMVKARQQALTSISAWPVDTIHKLPRGPACGFAMPRFVGYEPVHKLYSPRDRKHTFVQATWGFLIHSAQNVAAAFEAVHQAGHVIGDVNENSVLVGHDAIARLIDCDSFQIRSANLVFPCNVGVPLYTPPELVGKDFSKEIRTANHDNFGLAILIFHLLMMGRHPFAGVYTGKGEMPIERAILSFLFAYGRHANSKGMSPPPNSLSLAFLPPSTSSFFEIAFSEAGANRSRPNAKEWVDELGKLEKLLIRCPKDESHVFAKGSANCPWCEIEKTTGISFFIGKLQDVFNFSALGRAVTFDTFLAHLRSIPAPSFGTYTNPASMSLSGRAVDPAALVRASSITGSLVARIVGTVVLVIVVFAAPKLWLLWAGALWMLFGFTDSTKPNPFALIDAELATRQQELERVDNHLKQLIHSAPAQSGIDDYKRCVSRLPIIEAKKRGIPEWRDREISTLRAKSQARQLSQYLDQFLIKAYDIPNIGQSRKATLISWGIETAADIEKFRVMGIRGFGPDLANTLLSWQQRMAKGFKYDPTKAITDEDKRQVDIKVQHLQAEVVQDLRNAARDIENAHRACQSKIAEVKQAIERTVRLVAQAQADLSEAERAKRQMMS